MSAMRSSTLPPFYDARRDGVSFERQTQTQTAWAAPSRRPNHRKRKAIPSCLPSGPRNLPTLQHWRIDRYTRKHFQSLAASLSPLEADPAGPPARPEQVEAIKNPALPMPFGVPQVELGPSGNAGLASIIGKFVAYGRTSRADGVAAFLHGQATGSRSDPSGPDPIRIRAGSGHFSIGKREGPRVMVRAVRA